jgi:hypothetical protein
MLHLNGGGSHDTLGRHDTPRSIAAWPLRESALLSCPGYVPDVLWTIGFGNDFPTSTDSSG